jgi:hypothetical protein
MNRRTFLQAIAAGLGAMLYKLDLWLLRGSASADSPPPAAKAPRTSVPGPVPLFGVMTATITRLDKAAPTAAVVIGNREDYYVTRDRILTNQTTQVVTPIYGGYGTLITFHAGLPRTVPKVGAKSAIFYLPG